MTSAGKIWKALNEGVIGYIFYIVAGMVAAIVVVNVLGAALGTSIPLVAVLSGSMDHGINSDEANGKYPCSVNVPDYRESFDSWWTLCDFTYEEFNITKERFASFPFRDGFKRGDIPVIQSDDEYEVGDIVVFNIPSQSIPIIHRIVAADSERGVYQTKGDHNPGQNVYEKSVHESQIRGKVVLLIPYLGYLRVLLPIN